MSTTQNTPVINRIVRMTEFDLIRTAITKNDMYLCTDSRIMYYDETDNKRSIYRYVGVKTINDLNNTITPSYGLSYYCWEDNSLWLWLNKWVSLYSDSIYPSAYVYTDYPYIDHASDLQGVYNANNVLDNNGLLKDGSVVIRDRNRIIKGKLFVNDSNDNLVISSYLGGGIRLLPNGTKDTSGELFIGDENDAFIRSDFSIRNGEGYIDYSEIPEKDPSRYPNDTHKYKVFHEGNLDVSAALEMTPQQIYSKLQSNTLPDPLELNVSMVGGKIIDEISLVGHKHHAEDILDFNQTAREQANVQIKSVWNGMTGQGITVSAVGNTYRLSANNYTLTFGGGAIGSGTVNHLSDTTINLTVDPTKHIHHNYITRMDDLQTQINKINAMDKNDYYTRSETDNLLNDVKGTSTPTSGKPLLVDSSGILPGTTTSSVKLSQNRTVNFTGDITGTLSTDFSRDTSVELNAGNILSNTPVPGKALLVNANGELPCNTESASQLNHTINISLSGEVTGLGSLDTSKNKLDIRTTLQPGDNILQTKDLGVTVANIDTTTGQIPEYLIPQGAAGGLIPMGTFVPANGYPSTNPANGQFWIASESGDLNGEHYNSGDWCIYLDGEWQHIAQSNSVTSVNGQTGAVVLTSDDVKSISTDYINYVQGQPIPSGYIVRTTDDNTVEGLAVSQLISPFNVNTDTNSDVEINANSSNTSTDGTQDLGLKLNITDLGYNNIKEKAGFTLQSKGASLPHRKYLNFGTGLNVEDEGSEQITVSAVDIGPDNNCLYLQFDSAGNLINTEIIESFEKLYSNRETNPFVLIIDFEDNLYKGKITSTSPALDANATIVFPCYDEYINKGLQQSVGYMNLENRTSSLTVTVSSESVLTLNFKSTVNNTYGILTTSGGEGSVIPFLPTLDYQPTSKKYVDERTKGYVKSYTSIQAGTPISVPHNLGTENIIVQVRLISTKEEVLIKNRIIDSNTIHLYPSVDCPDGIQVYIKAV